MSEQILSTALVLSGPASALLNCKRGIEEQIRADGLRLVFCKTVAAPRKLFILEDGPSSNNGQGGGGR